MENSYSIIVPKKDWDLLQAEIDVLHDKLMDINGRQDVSVVKFNYGLKPYEVYTNSNIIKGAAEREEYLQNTISDLLKQIETYKYKKWWQIWI